MAVNSPFPYEFNNPEQSNCMAVFRLNIGTKYFIYKGLKVKKTVEGMSAQIHRERNNLKENSILFKVVTYIRQKRVTQMTVDVIKETDHPVDLLIAEYEALQAAKTDSNCLNITFFNNEYYPGWIPQKAVVEYNKWLQGEEMPNTHKNLKDFLIKHVDKNVADKIFKYVTERFKPGNESRKTVSKK